jgi:hypothetical protein
MSNLLRDFCLQYEKSAAAWDAEANKEIGRGAEIQGHVMVAADRRI